MKMPLTGWHAEPSPLGMMKRRTKKPALIGINRFPKSTLNSVTVLFHSVSPTTQYGRCRYYANFTYEETEVENPFLEGKTNQQNATVPTDEALRAQASETRVSQGV